MSIERKLSASSVAGIAIGSSLLVFAAITAMALQPILTSRSNYSRTTPAMLLWTLPVILVGIATMYLAIAAFKRGVQQEVWSPSALDQIRSRLDRPAWTIIGTALVLAVLTFAIFDISQIGSGKHHFNGYTAFSYFWFSPLMTLGMLRSALRPKPRPSPGTSMWLGEVKPVRSEHWGQHRL